MTGVAGEGDFPLHSLGDLLVLYLLLNVALGEFGRFPVGEGFIGLAQHDDDIG